MKSILVCISIIFCAILFNCKAQNDDVVTHVAPEELGLVLKDQNQMRLLDVRTPKEFKTGHIAGAENFDFLSEGFSKSLETLDRNEPLAIYCKSGRRSGKSIAVFKRLGFQKVYNLEGGILNWKSEGLQVVQD